MGQEQSLFDVTVQVAENLPVWPGDPPVEIAPVMRIVEGDDCNLSRLAMSNHTGTHVDAPWHFDDEGARLDEIPLDRWIGPCFVADLADADRAIAPTHLDSAGIPAGTHRLLLRTRNSLLWQPNTPMFVEDYVALLPASAQWIVDREIRLVGIDYYSVDLFENAHHDVHRTLLGNGVLVIENLNLTDLEPGHYELVCLPLKLIGVDGAPARVVLMDAR